jgi:dienelactone hydrolase
VRTIHAHDTARDRRFPCEIWYPDSAEPETWPLIVFSHGSAYRHRLMATYLCTHLCSHGYVVAAMDHSETLAPELMRRDGETPEQKKARVDAWIANRVPDIRFLLDHLLSSSLADSMDAGRIGIVGYSFGGWTALAATAVEPRIRAVVALAPGGSSKPRPGIIPATLDFDWGRDVPALYLVAENDTMTPLAGMYELFERTQGPRQMVVLRRADHIHFLDDVEPQHEAVRTMTWPGELAWIPQEMRPISELQSGEQSHLFVCGLTVCHMDAALKQKAPAQQFLAGDLEAELARRDIGAMTYSG